MRRAARWDGVHPGRLGEPLTPDDVRDLLAYIGEHHEGDGPFDVVVPGSTRGDAPGEATKRVRAYAEAGATWWLETCGVEGRLFPADEIERIVRGGPPTP